MCGMAPSAPTPSPRGCPPPSGSTRGSTVTSVVPGQRGARRWPARTGRAPAAPSGPSWWRRGRASGSCRRPPAVAAAPSGAARSAGGRRGRSRSTPRPAAPGVRRGRGVVGDDLDHGRALVDGDTRRGGGAHDRDGAGRAVHQQRGEQRQAEQQHADAGDVREAQRHARQHQGEAGGDERAPADGEDVADAAHGGASGRAGGSTGTARRAGQARGPGPVAAGRAARRPWCAAPSGSRRWG